MANSTLFLLLLLTFVPAKGDCHTAGKEMLSDLVVANLPKFTDEMVAEVRDMLSEIASAYMGKFDSYLVDKLSVTKINAVHELIENVVPSDMMKAVIKNGEIEVQMDKKKMVELITRELPAKCTKDQQKALTEAQLAGVIGAWEQEGKYKWKHRLDASGTARRDPVEPAKQASVSSSETVAALPCEQSLCVDDQLSDCIGSNSFTDQLFAEVSSNCSCPSIPSDWDLPKWSISPAMRGCLRAFKNSDPVSTLDCARDVMRATKWIIQKRIAPLICMFGSYCGNGLPELFLCLKDTNNRVAFVEALSGPTNECVQNIDPTCLTPERTKAVEDFANCVLDNIDQIC